MLKGFRFLFPAIAFVALTVQAQTPPPLFPENEPQAPSTPAESTPADMPAESPPEIPAETLEKAETPEPTPEPIAKKIMSGLPLFFQADKNNIQVLPQRFEFNLLDEDNIKIGDILIDSQTFGFQISPSLKHPGKYRARFVWPSSLLKDGSLLLKDNTGKAVWTLNFNRKKLRLVKDPRDAKQAGKSARTQLAEIIVEQMNPVLIEDMKYFPFMSLCISRTNLDTKIYLCSKEVYLTTKDNRLFISSRSKGKRTPFVEINGKTVGLQGTIFLNNENENIGFRAMTPSGAILEVETRMKPVDFKDVVTSANKKENILTASGTEPVNEDKVKRLNNEDWQISLDPQRPILYLKGEGDIPMRQEFYVKGEVPADVARPYLATDSVNRIYKSEVTLEATAAPQTQLSSTSDAESVEKVDGSRYRWNIRGIPAGETSRHYLRVSHDKSSYVAGYDIFRDFAFEANASASLWLQTSQVYADATLSWWIENFMTSSASWSRLHWGALLKQSVLFSKKTGEANANMTHLELLWRANSGFHFQDPTWGLILPVEMIQATGLSTTTFGVGAFYSDKAPKKYLKYLNWYDVKFNYLLGGSGGTVKLKSALQLSAQAYLFVDKRFSWTYGAGLTQYSFDPGTAKMQVQIQGGANYKF
jgi:hypothetical protein